MRRIVLATAVAVVLLLGSSASREPDELALVRVLGVDGVSPVVLTAVCGGHDQGDVSRGGCVREDFAQALKDLPWAGEKRKEELSLTSVSYLLVGRDIELEKVLEEVLRSQELGAASTVWLADGSVEQLLSSCEDPASGLSLLVRQGTDAPTAAKTLAALRTDGQVTLPLLGVGENGPELLGEQEWRRVA